VDAAAREAELIARHFEGDATLFAAFKAASLAQFEDDIARGNAAVAADDRAVLRRIAHDLKSVLVLLGDEPGAACAAALEKAAATPAPLADGWTALRRSLLAVC